MKELRTAEELDLAFEASAADPVLLLKHSTACPFSAAAYRRVVKYLGAAGPDAPAFYLVKVIEFRPLSNAIAARLGVTHESPQLILVRGNKAVAHASHGAITAAWIRGALGETS